MRILIALLLYLLIPLLILFLCMRSGDWWGLFAIVAYYAGLFMAMFRQWIFVPVPIIFCLWFWYTYGFSPTHFVTLLFLSMAAGVGMYEGYRQVHRFITKVLPEQLNNLDYNEKVEELNRRLERFRREHPHEKLTPEIVEKIRTEIFFS